MYKHWLKRALDFCLSLAALVLLSPLLLVLMVTGLFMMRGNPFFVQPRPGKDEKIFRLIKFRTMSNARDKNGRLLPDADRLNGYGKFLRSSSLDELPELINILKGDMAIVGPRPQLVRDMVFMSQNERRRHSVRQGLTGLAQINGRNNMSWEKKFEYDLQYIENITFLNDCKIIIGTVGKVLKRDGINSDGEATALDYGDYLLKNGNLNQENYEIGQKKALEIINSQNIINRVQKR